MAFSVMQSPPWLFFVHLWFMFTQRIASLITIALTEDRRHVTVCMSGICLAGLFCHGRISDQLINIQ